MIGRLTGTVVVDDPGAPLILDVHGVGYELSAPLGTAGRAAPGPDQTITVFVHTHAREDTLELFGFASELDRRVFRLLISVPNVGPKTALGILSALPTPELARAVQEQNVGRLTRVPGIGKKTAERLLLELKEKLPQVDGPVAPTAATPSTAKPDDAKRLFGALTSMGYRPAEAERAVTALAERIGQAPLSTLLREALARLTP
ncbi:MAG TPA: Holliday junction branch migration protein RuvA [Polyangiaceae bacterium]|nr:Holliday junction branch migration protein RuvA [Polyangiaceae bacterium]